jgi:hypothetical protein
MPKPRGTCAAITCTAWRSSGAGRRASQQSIAVTLCALGSLVGCGKPPSIGETNDIVVGAASDIWDALEDEIVATLEPRAFTVREERMFDVAYIPLPDTRWRYFRRLRQILLIGSAKEPLISEALAGRSTKTVTPPVLIQLPDVWAENQLVTVALLPDSAEPQVVEPMLPKIGEVFTRQLEDRIRIRMAITPRNERLAEQLRRVAGFTLALPWAYDYEQVDRDLFIFRHELGWSAPVSRNIMVAAHSRDSVDWTAEGAAPWRAELAERLNQPVHLTEVLPKTLQGRLAGRPTIQIQGIWSTPPDEWPSAGPFISRMVDCSDRVFLIDAWLYAPAKTEKYDYMYELDLILDTFRCAA